ncbi:hypothetical protein [Sphingobacterium sp. GVS05A]|uniref:hypothetical protein n=1 Tax=Sphingobacterium sp. GVS05A TaxID=2862679 RepID=UPI001CBF364C|nr:hypothetical protein [Sphingobacterium sp. GVS05A]
MIVTTSNSSVPIAANVIIRTTIFSEIGAGYVDFFGGRIGLSEDIDEISGKVVICLSSGYEV